MTKAIPHIEKYMTCLPHSIGLGINIKSAEEIMGRLKIRHLPVLEGGTLKGVISDRDLKLFRALVSEADAQKSTIEDLMQDDAYVVDPKVPLDTVLSTMAERRIGSAVVMDNQKLVGIFTTTDAMTACANLLRTRLG